VERAATRSPLMLIHGAWLSSRSWDPFAEYFRERGYDVSAPEWPRKQGDVEELREATEAIEGLGLTEIVDHYEAQIRALDREPILIGHSFGGLIVELLLDRGLARGGVAMSPAPPKGILVLPFSTLKVVSTALAHKSRWHGVVPLTLEEFTYGFVNTFTPEEAKAAYEKYYVPESGQIFFEAGFANFHLHPPTELHFHVRGSGTATDHRRRPGPHSPRLGLEEAVQEVREVSGTDRLPRIRRPAPPDDGGREMGRNRRGDRRLDRRRAREDRCRRGGHGVGLAAQQGAGGGRPVPGSTSSGGGCRALEFRLTRFLR
jgi:pimeloyl-ACP methyl ester carboxylesterase